MTRPCHVTLWTDAGKTKYHVLVGVLLNTISQIYKVAWKEEEENHSFLYVTYDYVSLALKTWKYNLRDSQSCWLDKTIATLASNGPYHLQSEKVATPSPKLVFEEEARVSTKFAHSSCRQWQRAGRRQPSQQPGLPWLEPAQNEGLWKPSLSYSGLLGLFGIFFNSIFLYKWHLLLRPMLLHPQWLSLTY